jgi:DNA-binding transcriptional MerR regulator
VSSSAQFLNASDAAKRLGVSAKALRLYEERGLVSPGRTMAGWRAYGPDEIAKATEVAALRALGFSLAQVARVLEGDVQGLEPALAAHQVALEGRVRQVGDAVEKVRRVRADLARGVSPTGVELALILGPIRDLTAAFELPWPWGGERFELRDIRALNHIIGPLGSGKTIFGLRLSQALPDAGFLPMDRSAELDRTMALLNADAALNAKVGRISAWLVEDGAVATKDLIVLLAALEADAPSILVVDMVEQGLDQATQEALIAYLRRRGPDARPLFLLTRSSAILDLTMVGPDEAIILCPANHSPPSRVLPYPGAPGYEAVSTCLASPAVRARTEGVRAVRARAAS